MGRHRLGLALTAGLPLNFNARRQDHFRLGNGPPEFRIESMNHFFRGVPAICLLFLAVSASAATGDLKLVWSDEFDKPGLPDPAKWNYETGFLRNNEAQYYTR